MAELTETHERVHVDYQHMQSTTASPKGSIDAQILAPVSMMSATTVTVNADLIAWKATGTALRVEVRLQQSSDGANWFEVPPPSGNTLSQAVSPTPPVNPAFTGVGMAWARVVLMIDKAGTLAVGDGAIVKVVITTS